MTRPRNAYSIKELLSRYGNTSPAPFCPTFKDIHQECLTRRDKNSMFQLWMALLRREDSYPLDKYYGVQIRRV
jgi:hypothetical protein